MRARNIVHVVAGVLPLSCLLVLPAPVVSRAAVVRLQSEALTLEVEDGTAAWKMTR